MHPRVLLLLALCCVFAAAQDEPLIGGPGAKASQQPQTVTLVKTWADLQAVKPLEVGEGVKIRLGIEATEAPVMSGVLLYALVEGFHNNDQDDPDTQLGPLKMNVELPGPATSQKEEPRAPQQRLMGDWDGIALFCRVLPLKTPGEYKVNFSSNGVTLASAALHATSAPYHSWSVFHSVRWNEIDEAPQDGVLTGYLGYARFDPGVPYLSGVDPLLVVPDVAQKGNAALPHLQDIAAVASPARPEQAAHIDALVKALSEDDFDLREAASRELRNRLPEAQPQLEKARLAAKDVETRSRLEGLIRSAFAATLHVEATNEEAMLTFVGGLHASWPEDYYLVRWWVNDKPVILEANRELEDFKKVGAMRMAEQMRLRWKIDWALLGAKSGDHVALQLMYCPAGVRLVAHDLEYARADAALEFGQKPVLSNRTEFVLP